MRFGPLDTFPIVQLFPQMYLQVPCWPVQPKHRRNVTEGSNCGKDVCGALGFFLSVPELIERNVQKGPGENGANRLSFVRAHYFFFYDQPPYLKETGTSVDVGNLKCPDIANCAF